MKKGMFWVPVALMIVLALVAGCTSPADVDVSDQPTAAPDQPTAAPEQPAALDGKLIIFHAGSLTVPMKELTEAFQAKYPGVTFETEASGSNAAARKISELEREADLMMSADYTVIDKLLIPDFAGWNIQFARNTMVIAYTDESLYAGEINADNWYEILTREGVIYGHSDPDADPCGYRTLLVWQLAEAHYGVPGLNGTLEEHCPPENVRPKSVELIALLESGDMDYAFEYRSVAVQHGMKFVELPDEINLSMVEHAGFYSQATVEIAGKEPGTVMTMVGKPIVYGVTVPKNALSPDLALEFVKFLIGPEGQAIMEMQGQPPIVPPVSSTWDALPSALQDMVHKVEATSTSETIEVVDALGRTITFDELPQRIVIPGKGSWMVGHPLYLFPEASERLTAMEERRGNVSDFIPLIDPDFNDKPRLEQDSAPEQIVPLKPDAVIVKSYMQERLGNPLEEVGIPVVYVELETPEQYFNDITTMGQLLGNEERAKEVISFYQARLDRLSERVKDIGDADKPDVLVVQHISKGGEVAFQVAPPSWMQTIQVKRAGGNPVWADDVEGGGWSVVNLEQIAAWDPDKIFVVAFKADPDALVGELKADPTWQELRAVQNGELYAFPADLYGWDVPDPRWILGMTWAATKTHPGLFSDVDMMQEVYDFYGELYGMDKAVVDEYIVPEIKGDIQ